MHMWEQKEPCTITFPAILEMENWGYIDKPKATQHRHAAVAMQLFFLLLFINLF